MRTLLLLVSVILRAQDTPAPPLVKATITPLGGIQRVTINNPGPIGPNDDLGLWSPTRKIQVVLITPAGKRVSESTASENGVDWRQKTQLTDSAEADSPLSISVRFPTQATPGNYVFEITPEELERPMEVTAAFRAEVKSPAMPAALSAPNIIMLGPVKAAPGATLDFTIPQDEESAIVDVLVTVQNAKVRLQMPGNQLVDPLNAANFGLRWRVTDNPSTLDPPGALLSLSGFYIPGKGWHHVINFQRAPQGAYRVLVEVEQPAQASVAFLPTARLIQTAFDSVERLARPRESEVRLSANPVPGVVHAGDNVLLQVYFDGEPVSRPIQFQGVFEYVRPNAPPEIRRMPLYMGWAMDDTFRTYFQPEREGEMRIKVSASGRTVTGLPFSLQTELPPVMVKPVGARLMGIWEQPVDTDNNGLLDRLDVHVELEMVQPAAVDLSMMISTRTKQSARGEMQRQIAAGRQRLTVSFPASQMLGLNGDGPYFVENIQIKLRLADGSTDEVQTAGYRIGTQAYTRAQWEPKK